MADPDAINACAAESSQPESQRRIALFRHIFEVFLSAAPRNVPKGRVHPFVIFDQDNLVGHYVQFKLFSDEPEEGDEVYGEVGSREWSEPAEPNRPLPPAARAFLAAHGFTGGGPATNYGRRHLPMDAAWLAGLTEALFSVYDPPPDFAVRVKSDVPAVELAFLAYRPGTVGSPGTPASYGSTRGPAGRAALHRRSAGAGPPNPASPRA